MTTNEANSVNVASGRRWVLVEVNDKMTDNVEYFNALYNEIANDDCIRSFWHYILSELDPTTKLLIDIGKYNFQNERPLTQYYKDVLTRNIDNFTQFLGYLLYKCCDTILDDHDNFVGFEYEKKSYKYLAGSMRSDMNKFYDILNDTDKKFKMQHKTMISKFREIKHMGQYCIVFKRTNSNRYYEINLDSLNKYLKRNYPHFYDNIYEIMNIYSISNCWINNDSDTDTIEEE